jgi:glycosyltransferase involved in cell wall biosynthesis
VEALAAGVPSIFTLSGIACDFIKHQKNAWVVNFKNAGEISQALSKMLGDRALRNDLTSSGMTSVKDRFSMDDMLRKLHELYSL